MLVPELTHAVLYVRDLERSRQFYGQVLGLPVVAELAPGGRVVGAALGSGRSPYDLLLLEVGFEVAPVPAGRRVGLAHLGLKIGEDDDALRVMRDRLRATGVEVADAVDRGVTHGLVVADPDGNEVELYVEVVAPEVWRRRPDLLLRAPAPLEL